MSAYPQTLREKIIKGYDEGQTYKELAQALGISPNTVRNIVKLREQTGSVAPRPHQGGRPKSLNDEDRTVLRKLRESAPGAPNQELTERLFEVCGKRVSANLIGRELRKMGFVRMKPTRSTTEKPDRPKEETSHRSQRVVSSPPRYQRREPGRFPIHRKPYPSDLSDAEWAILEPLIPLPKKGGRLIKHDRREVMNALFYVLRTGCPWRMLPHDFPPWSTVHDLFRQWRNSGLWERINAALREQSRVKAGRNATPSAAIIDSQSVKTTEKGGRVDMMRERR